MVLLLLATIKLNFSGGEYQKVACHLADIVVLSRS
jgi:hypothetical protein